MSAKIDYITSEQTILISKASALQVKIGKLISAIKSGQKVDLKYLTENGIEPNRDRTQAKYNALKLAVDEINNTNLTIKSQVDFMAGYDAAVDSE